MPKVFKVTCKDCGQLLTNRAQSIYLISSPSQKGFSTDIPPPNVKEVAALRTFQFCDCKVTDLLCAACNQKCGHHVVQGCSGCLDGPNNGHYWILMRGNGQATTYDWDAAGALPV